MESLYHFEMTAMTAYLLVDGARIEPVADGTGQFQFRFCLPAREIRLISGSARPVDFGSSADDRRLGVELHGMQWMQGETRLEVPIDSPGFVDGFHYCERRTPRDVPVRWTSGNAGLPPSVIPPWFGEIVLDLALKGWAGSANGVAGSPEAALLDRFESLGEDCEFGLVQRHYGVEPPLTLFRWSGTRFEDLVRGLESRFDGLEAAVEAVWSGSQYFLRTPLLTMHTTCTVEQDVAGLAEIVASGRATLRILRRKLLRDIAEAKRIFVFASLNPHFGAVQMRRLHRALRRVGPAHLLCVRLAGAGEPPGEVERMGGGLYAGTLRAFAKPAGPFDEWLQLCARTMDVHTG
jgi:hypothetical protein